MKVFVICLLLLMANESSAQQTDSHADRGSASSHSVIGAIGLSAIYPGLGQMYNGHRRKGTVLLLSYAASTLTTLIYALDYGIDSSPESFAAFKIGLVCTGGIWVYSMTDAVINASRIRTSMRSRNLSLRLSLLKDTALLDSDHYSPVPGVSVLLAF